MSAHNRLTLIQRTGATLESYIAGPLGKYFLSSAYIDGLCEKRNEIYAKQARAAGFLITTTTLLALFDSFVGSNVSVLGITFEIRPVFASALTVIVASAFFAAVTLFVDQLLIDNYLATIGRSVGLHSFGVYTLPKTALNLWSEAITPKYFGPVSGRGHHLGSRLLLGAMLLFALLYLIYPTYICIVVIFRVLTKLNASFVEQSLVVFAGLNLAIAWLFALLFCFKYKFKRADFDEAAGTPTAEFVKEIEEEQKRSQVSDQASP